MWINNIENLPIHEVLQGMRGRFVHSEHMTFAFWEIDKNFILPEHRHNNEQVTHILNGEFELSIAGKTQTMKAGQIAIIPSNTLHSGKALTDCKILDSFSPRREDYIFNEMG